MTTTTATIADRNPFATRHVRPGSIPFVFTDRDNAAKIIERLAGAHWQGEIVGPHGSGKSTLLATLVPLIESRGRQVRQFALHDGQRRLPGGWAQSLPTEGPVLIVVDGYEQLGRFQRWRLKRLCRRRGWGLLVTAHASVGLPTIFETATTLDLAEQIIAGLGAGRATIDRDEVAASFRTHRGNLREVLFDCYDLHRRRGRLEDVANSTTLK